MTADWIAGPPAPRVPADDEVHVWRLDVDRLRSLTGRYWSTLSAGERDRAARLRLSRDRERFVSARGALRDVLGAYLGALPQTLHLAATPFGKPYLAQALGSDADDLHFSVSRSHGIGLIAVVRRHQIGVDVEHVRSDFDWHPIAKSYFAPADVIALQALPEAEQCVGFHELWTRLEARIKASGGRLTELEREWDAHRGSRPPRGGSDGAPVHWTGSIDPGAGYVASLAGTGRPRGTRLFDYEPMRRPMSALTAGSSLLGRDEDHASLN